MNDLENGNVRKGVDAVQVASCCIALWNGLVHSHIANFLACGLEETLRNAYAAIWRDISKMTKKENEDGKERE